MTETQKTVERFYNDVIALNIRFPVAEIAKRTGFGKSDVSQTLTKKKTPSVNFLKKFYEVFFEDLQNAGLDAALTPGPKIKSEANENPKEDTYKEKYIALLEQQLAQANKMLDTTLQEIVSILKKK